MAAIKKGAYRFYEGFTRLKMVVSVVVVLLYVALALYGGAKFGQMLLFGVILAVYIIIPGLLAADLLKAGRINKFLSAPLALLLGSGFFTALYCFSMRLHIIGALRIIPPLLSIIWLVRKVLQVKKEGRATLKAVPSPASLTPPQWMLILLYCALLLFYTFYGVIKNAHPLSVGDTLLNQDLLWNVGNANSFKLAFPPQDIRFTGVRLSYHYLTEMIVGALSIVSGISSYDIAAFFMQPYMLAALVLCLYRLGRMLWEEGPFRPLLFSYSMFLFTCASLWKILPNGWSVFWNSNTTHLITNINGQTTATVLLCIFTGLLLAAMQKKYKTGPLHYILLFCALVMLSFAKGPIAAIVVCSLALTVIIGLFQKTSGWRGLLFGLAAAGLFVLIYVTMFRSGANDSMPFSLTGTMEKGYFYNILNLLWHTNHTLWMIGVPVLWVAQSFLMAPAVFPLYIRGLGRDLRHFNKIPQIRLLANGVVVGGLMAFFWFNHPSMSQVYFLFGALFFLYLLAVDNLPLLREMAKNKQGKAKTVLRRGFLAFTAFFAAVAVATTGFLYIHYMGSGGRQLLRNLGVIEKYPYDAVMKPEDEAGMLWLAQNSGNGDMFATNRIHTGARREGISNLYSALCGRQGYMEGFTYAKTNMGVPEDSIAERLAVNTALFSAATSPEDILQLCRQNNIRFLIFSTQFDGEDTQLQFLEKVYDEGTLRIYEVPV